MPVRGCFGVERDSDVGGALVLQHVEQRVGENEQRRCVDAFGRKNGPADQREVRAIDQRHAIEQEEFLRHDARLTQPVRKPNKKSGPLERESQCLFSVAQPSRRRLGCEFRGRPRPVRTYGDETSPVLAGQDACATVAFARR